MTYAEILALPAGRELDALVHQHVFDHSLNCAPYSTDTAAAWQVVERFRADPAFRWTDFAVFTYVCVATGRREYLVDFAGGNCPGRAGGETLPLAVCRAALSLVIT